MVSWRKAEAEGHTFDNKINQTIQRSRLRPLRCVRDCCFCLRFNQDHGKADVLDELTRDTHIIELDPGEVWKYFGLHVGHVVCKLVGRLRGERERFDDLDGFCEFPSLRETLSVKVVGIWAMRVTFACLSFSFSLRFRFGGATLVAGSSWSASSSALRKPSIPWRDSKGVSSSPDEATSSSGIKSSSRSSPRWPLICRLVRKRWEVGCPSAPLSFVECGVPRKKQRRNEYGSQRFDSDSEHEHNTPP